jgi:hypothetical protein
LKRCKYCGWWFEPSKPRQVYCDDECRHEAELETKRKWWRKNKGTKKPSSILKVDVSRLPPPTLPPTKEVKRVDRNLQKLFEQMERRRNFEG